MLTEGIVTLTLYEPDGAISSKDYASAPATFHSAKTVDLNFFKEWPAVQMTMVIEVNVAIFRVTVNWYSSISLVKSSLTSDYQLLTPANIGRKSSGLSTPMRSHFEFGPMTGVISDT